MRNGKKHGTGEIQFANGDFYSGCWVDEHRMGDGTYIFCNGDRYTRIIQISLIWCSELVNIEW